MRNGSHFSLAISILLALSFRSPAASTGATGLDQEYAQVRKIALKDPRVQDAFKKANERLDARIIEIDPALKPIVEKREAAPSSLAEPGGTVSQYRPAIAAVSPAPGGHHHLVVKGETLSSIAAHYKVTVPALEKVNHITDARKLRIGQDLVIPSTATRESSVASPSPETSGTQSSDGGNLWDRIKSGL